MEIRDILQIIRKRWLIIALTAAVCLAGAAAVSFFMLSNVYEADTIMIIASPRDAQQNQLTLNDYTLNTKLVDSYRVLCKTDRILNQVAGETKLNLSAAQLSGKISVTAESDTEIIRITAQDGDPDTAAAIANAVANVFVREIPKIMKMDNVQVIDKATPRGAPVKPDRKMILAVAALLGLLLGFGVSVLMEYLDVSVKSTEQMEKMFDAPVLGIVPHMQERD